MILAGSTARARLPTAEVAKPRRLIGVMPKRLVEILIFGAIPVLGFVGMVRSNLNPAGFFDLHVFWHAAKAVLSGKSPYPTVKRIALGTEDNFVYPAPMALLLAPLGLVPFSVATGVYCALATLALFGALWVLGVRDWRCYGVALLPMTTKTAISTGTISPFLLFGAATAWAYRDRRAVAATATAALIVAKLFAWPIFFWLLATRRFKTAAWAVAGAVTATLVAWGALGFAGFSSYPSLVNTLASVESEKTFSLLAFGLILGIPMTLARIALLALALALTAIVVVVGRRPGGDEKAFLLALASALLLSPIVWGHYLILLLIPIALVRPRLSPLWFAPLAFNVAMSTAHNEGSTWRIAFVLALSTAILVRCSVRLRHEQPVTSEPSIPLQLA